MLCLKAVQGAKNRTSSKFTHELLSILLPSEIVIT